MNREDFKGYLKTAAILTVLSMIVVIPIALAATYLWNMKISWTVPVDETIDVYTDVACTVPWDHTLDLVDVSTPQTFDFYIKNEGDVTVDVTITENSLTGATAVWTPTTISNLAVGTNAQMSLELTFTADGSYDFDFTSNESP